MSADTLRRAAALMRERATAATPGPWAVPDADDEYVGPADVVGDGIPGDRYIICEHAGQDAPFIASWHPTVALAVADCIDAALCYFDPDEFSEAEREMHDSLLTLARTYLNESA